MKPHETFSTGQGVGGNSESEGSNGKPAGPSESKPMSSMTTGATLFVAGEAASVAYGGHVGEAGMLVLSLHDDLGRPSVLREIDSKAAAPRERAMPTGTKIAVATGAIRERRGQGVGWGHSSNDAPGNRGAAKGPWSTKVDAEGTCEHTIPRKGPI